MARKLHNLSYTVFYLGEDQVFKNELLSLAADNYPNFFVEIPEDLSQIVQPPKSVLYFVLDMDQSETLVKEAIVKLRERNRIIEIIVVGHGKMGSTLFWFEDLPILGFVEKADFKLNRIEALINKADQQYALENSKRNSSLGLYKILIADDVETNLLVLEQLLKGDDRVIDKASSGIQAVEKALENDYALIMLDVHMPDMDGFEVARLLKRNTLTKNTPIVFVTAFNRKPEFVVKGLEYGAIDYLYKPLDPEITKSKVASFLKINQYQRMVQSRNAQLNQQKNIIQDKNNSITSSITYAGRIQNALLPNTVTLQDAFPQHFVLYKPKDIVSGDFYWVYKGLEYTFLAVIDCTGHGVPGALMSMIANSLFNKVVLENQKSTTGLILDEVRDNLIESLRRDRDDDFAPKDGMDVGLLKWNHNDNSIEYSGAGIPLWLINPSRDLWEQNFHLQEDLQGLGEIKGDSQPIGLYPFPLKPYKTNKIALQKGDLIYISSDGYADQFGGDNGGKLKRVHFKHKLLSCYDKPLAQQRNALNTFFVTWKGLNQQTDDVCLVGLQLQ